MGPTRAEYRGVSSCRGYGVILRIVNISLPLRQSSISLYRSAGGAIRWYRILLVPRSRLSNSCLALPQCRRRPGSTRIRSIQQAYSLELGTTYRSGNDHCNVSLSGALSQPFLAQCRERLARYATHDPNATQSDCSRLSRDRHWVPVVQRLS